MIMKAPPQTSTPPQELPQKLSPFLTGMAKGSLLLVGVDAVKLS